MKKFKSFSLMAWIALAVICSGSSSISAADSSPITTAKCFFEAMEKYDMKSIEKYTSADLFAELEEELTYLQMGKIEFTLKELKSESVNEEECTVEWVVEISVANEKKGEGVIVTFLTPKEREWRVTALELNHDFQENMENIVPNMQEFSGQDYSSQEFSRLFERELRFEFLKGKFLGEAIKQVVPNLKKVAILVDPTEIYDPYGEKLATPLENPSVAALKEALGADVESVLVSKEIPKVKPQTIQGPSGEEFELPPLPPDPSMTRNDLDKILPQIKDVDVFIIVTSLFSWDGKVIINDYWKDLLKFFKANNIQNVAIMEPAMDTATLVECFQDDGKCMANLVAVVFTKNSADYDKDPPLDDKEAFDIRYVLATSENYQQSLAEKR